MGAVGGDPTLVFGGWHLYLNEEGLLKAALSQSVHLQPLEHLLWSCSREGFGNSSYLWPSHLEGRGPIQFTWLALLNCAPS